ncbi:MAG: hypothetical protein HN778_20555 [Prolixibacteraceae bacterium]|jgi:hypothetical protein|nr:hypothetical protein [Prolixibacteraceae bacterium]MBT6763253.1 hypothetical protein [Prolixibacteraceae bacterium]MBT7000312.1 hypothetical protein [Prolixibacteraceae bacterium]MBT7397229.1 hypothetical protein [Prolixibacteraceae bacterium]
MKKYVLFIILFVLGLQTVFAQEEETKEKDKPVRSPFESGYLIDNQTTLVPVEGTLEYVIQHKFGTMSNGMTDLYGIYSPGANIRLGLNYVPIKNVQVGIGATKKNKYTDLNAKWTILEQTRENTIPIAVSLYGMVAVDGRNESLFGSGKIVDTKGPTLPTQIAFNDRLSYFSQIIIGRKFTDWLSLQAAASFTHYNMVGWEYDHDKIAVHFNGRIKFSPQTSFIFNYDIPLKIKDISEQWEWTDHPKPNLAFGVEISTSTHAFQIYAGTADGIIPQDMVMWNLNDWKDKGLAIGMTITRLWNF